MTDTRDYLTVRRLHPDNADRYRAEKYRAALENIQLILEVTGVESEQAKQIWAIVTKELDELNGVKK